MTKRIAMALALLAAALPVLAHGVDRGEAKTTVAGKLVSIDYGRPMLSGRDMLGQAEVGKPWRMGADDATTLKTAADLKFGEVAIPKGDYILTATKVADDTWQMNFTRAADKAIVGSAPLASSKLEASVETFTIELAGKGDRGELALTWGTTALKVGFSGK